MKQIEIERKTVDEAIQQGLEELGLSLEDVRIDVLEEGSKGLFGLIGSKQAKVRLTVREEEAQTEVPPPKLAQPVPPMPEYKPEARREAAPVQPKPAPKPEVRPVFIQEQEAKPAAKRDAKPRPEPRTVATEAAQAPKRPPRAREEEESLPLEPGEAEPTTALLKEIASLMGVEAEITVSERDGTLLLDVMGDEKGILIGHRGETLDALQYLMGLIHNKGRERYRRVQLDSQNYRKKREETLVRLANRLADKAYRSGKRVALEPMNPYERRILHSALQGNDRVTTHSEGEEPNRRVVIVPK